MSHRTTQRGRLLRCAGLLATAAGLTALAGTPATAAGPAGSGLRPVAAATPAAPASAAATLAARTGLSPAQLAAQERQVAVARTITTKLGARAAGAYQSGGSLMVNVVDAQAAATVTRQGLRARVVAHSLTRLAAVSTALDRQAKVVGSSWGIDVRANKVALTVPASAPASAGLLAAARRYAGEVTVTRTTRSVATYSQVIGGYPLYRNDGARCSAGFNVRNSTTRFVLTAGHCTVGGGTWTNFDGAYIGPSVAGYFPGQDHGLVRIDGPVSQVNGVYLWNNYYQPITGAGYGYAGLSACKSGSTTGLTCGTVQLTNVTVNYPQGTVYGLDQTNICTQAGDSGGSYFTGSTALGMVSGGVTGTCTSFFQPVVPALNYWGVSLI